MNLSLILGQISDGLTNLKGLALGLGDEIERQNVQLGRMDPKVRKANDLLENQNKQMRNILRKWHSKLLIKPVPISCNVTNLDDIVQWNPHKWKKIFIIFFMERSLSFTEPLTYPSSSSSQLLLLLFHEILFQNQALFYIYRLPVPSMRVHVLKYVFYDMFLSQI